MQNNEELLKEMLKAEVSMQDLITDIYAVNLAMYMEGHTLNMPAEFIEMGKRFLIERNISFMSQHMQEVWVDYHRLIRQVREQGEHAPAEPDLKLSDAG